MSENCKYNVSEDSCPNCEREEDCPIEQTLQILMNIPWAEFEAIGQRILVKLQEFMP